ncbi:hypothetical protein FFT09_17090 [Saccharomonospora piscinae]|uniref:hypothetical protein n=1 Tax=Saccharomonospora piscinae TaxID=687388 RepID=UPI00110585A2|nr:hypothetical protein [Saccharomonospora piscinae]TLW90993.1 hypothetical protein FFT09_17090 [Saccharomonospora piscinae]
MTRVTSQQSQYQPVYNRVSAGGASDAKAFATAVLLTFTSGMLALIGYVMVGVFGVILAIIGIAFGLMWWKEQHKSMLPRDVPGKSLAGLAVAGAVLFGLAALMA